MTTLAELRCSFPNTLNVILSSINHISVEVCNELVNMDYIQKSNFSTKQSQLQDSYNAFNVKNIFLH